MNDSSWNDFTNNLATDLAPLLALFGEQVTKQYLSESLDWLDHVILAMAPLGILTVVVSAVRVRGSSAARAFIGRAQESRGNVEAELMSSTSHDVCELWNGDGVARVLGQPRILEIVIDTSAEDAASAFYDHAADSSTVPVLVKPSCNLYTFKEHIRQWRSSGRDDPRSAPWLCEKIPAKMEYDFLQYDHAADVAPNLSLNIGMVRPSYLTRALLALAGTLLQAAVLVYACVAYYHLNLPNEFNSKPWYALVFVLFGTLMVNTGMFMCAWVNSGSTEQEVWSRRSWASSEMFWLQSGGQTVGDQLFGPFACRARPAVYLTSKNTQQTSTTSEMVVYFACIWTLTGFILQFVGFRGMHPSVTLAQLVAIVIMAVIRAAMRMKRSRDNLLKGHLDRVQNSELDWLGLEIHSCKAWKVCRSESPLPYLLVNGITPGNEDFQRTILAGMSAAKTFTLTEQLHLEASLAAYLKDRALLLPLSEIPEPNLPTRIFRSRARLGRVAHSWTTRVRNHASNLQLAIEGTANIIFSGDMRLLEGWQNVSTILWPLAVALEHQRIVNQATVDASRVKTVAIPMRRTFDSENNAWTGWKVEESEVEAALSLWLWSLNETATDPDTGTSSIMRLFSEESEKAKTDYKMWVFRQTPLITGTVHLLPFEIGLQLEHGGTRVFGQSGVYDLAELSRTVPMKVAHTSCKTTLVNICSQELFSAFFAIMSSLVSSIGGVTTRRSIRQGNDDTHRHDITPNNETFRLKNTVLSLLALNFNDKGLGTIEEAFMCLVPVLRSRKLLPSAVEAHDDARESSRKGAQQHKWPEASELLWWIYHSTSNSSELATGIEECLRSASDIGELYRHAIHLDDDNASRDFGYKGIRKMLTDMRLEGPEYQIAKEYAWIAIRYAAITRDASQRAALLSAGADYEMISAYSDHMTVTEAASLNCLPSVKLKLTISLADMNAKDLGGETALMCAAKLGHMSVARLLLAHGATDTKNNVGHTALYYAAANGFDDIAELLLVDNESWIDFRDKQGRTPLSWAAENGQLPVCERLLKFPAVNIDMRDKLLQTPLFKAAEHNRLQVVELLAAKGADCDACDSSNATPLLAAIENGSVDLISFLCARGANVQAPTTCDETPLYRACWYNRVDIAHLLVTRGASLTYMTQSGEMPLHAAARNDSQAIVEILINAGADVNVLDEFCRTPLHFAVLKERCQILSFLLSHGADIDAETSTGETALHLAARCDSTPCLGVLLRHNPNASATNRKGETALFLAATYGCVRAVERLVTIVSNLEVSDSRIDHETPLHVAAKNGHKEIVRVLLSEGAKINALTSTGDTVLSLAETFSQQDVIDMLVASDAMGHHLSTRAATQKKAQLPTLGVFCTYEQHGWGNPAISHTKSVQFTPGYTQIPHVSVGLNMINIQKWYNPRVEVSADNLLKNGFSIHLNTWADSILLAAAASWISLPSNDGDIQSGELRTSDLRPWYRPEKRFANRVTFARPYREVPNIFVQLQGFDLDISCGLRVKAYAVDVTKVGFNLCLDTWEDSTLYYGSLSWIAHAKGKAGICSGTADALVTSDRKAQAGQCGTVRFPEGLFNSTPTVHLALAWLEVDNDENLRIECHADNVTASSFDWHIGSWLSSKFLGAGVAFMAIEGAGETPRIAASYQ